MQCYYQKNGINKNSPFEGCPQFLTLNKTEIARLFFGGFSLFARKVLATGGPLETGPGQTPGASPPGGGPRMFGDKYSWRQL